LPLAACRIRSADEQPAAAGAFRAGAFVPTWTAAEHAAAVDRVRAAIGRGDVYQVNLVQHLRAPFAGAPGALAAALAPLRAEWAYALHGDGWSIVSATPELFLQTRGDVARTMPIKGTRPADTGGPIAESAKDRAEHVMIVDLERNDLGRVCRPGSVRVSEYLAERPMAGVRHMVSTVEGRLRPGVGLAELLRATFPGGSVTGAPKLAAIDHIARSEPVGRGASMGALGVVHANGDLDLGLTIRTLAVADGGLHLWVGGGIVWDSDPAAEVEESLVKARPLARLIGAALPEGRA
jgi:para-aminobenzoate synthetase component 1